MIIKLNECVVHLRWSPRSRAAQKAASPADTKIAQASISKENTLVSGTAGGTALHGETGILKINKGHQIRKLEKEKARLVHLENLICRPKSLYETC